MDRASQAGEWRQCVRFHVRLPWKIFRVLPSNTSSLTSAVWLCIDEGSKNTWQNQKNCYTLSAYKSAKFNGLLTWRMVMVISPADLIQQNQPGLRCLKNWITDFEIDSEERKTMNFKFHGVQGSLVTNSWTCIVSREV